MRVGRVPLPDEEAAVDQGAEVRGVGAHEGVHRQGKGQAGVPAQ